MASYENLGPCTIALGTTPGTDYAGEFLNVKIVHNYEDIGDSRTMLDGEPRAAQRIRTDGLSASLENDLTDVGLYAYLYSNDLVETDIVITQSESGVSWTGKVSLSLPAEIGADEFGSPIVSDIEWAAVGVFTFAPSVSTP